VKRFMQLTAMSAGAAIALLTFPILSAEAVTRNFSTDISSGALTGQSYQGTLSYDGELLTGLGRETISAFDGLTINFSFLGNTYTEKDDFSLGANGKRWSCRF
jgi:hypothetical protein